MSEPERDAADRETAAGRCPICGKPRVPSFRPFCSRRCADVDLHRWLAGVYSIPATEDDEDGNMAGGLAPELDGERREEE